MGRLYPIIIIITFMLIGTIHMQNNRRNRIPAQSQYNVQGNKRQRVPSQPVYNVQQGGGVSGGRQRIPVRAANTVQNTRQRKVKKRSPFLKSLNFLHKNIKPPELNESLSIRGDFNIIVENITQKLDHFNPNVTEIWQMRYFSNGEFFKPNGPIFIFIGGEAEAHDGFLRGGILHEMANEHNGYLLSTEHRFYGKSIPTSDLSLKNLKYLRSYQALADLAHLIRTYKAKPEFAKSKVIVASGSYPGSLAVWLQRLYPDLVDGSWASSAPLLAKVDFPEYKEVVGNSIRIIGGDACLNRFINGIKILEAYVDNNRIPELRKILKVCEHFDESNWLDVGALFSSISNVAAGLVQNHDPGDIEKNCREILSAEDDVTGIANWYNSKLGDDTDCFDYTFPSSINHMKEIEISDSIWRQWTYTLCKEFGFSQTSSSQYQPFGTKFPVGFYENICEDVFGINKEKLYANVERTNKYYGGLNPNVTNVYYSHGGLDPWYPAGVQTNDDGVSTIIPYYAHCKDFDSVSESDSAELKASKEKLKKYVRKWLA